MWKKAGSGWSKLPGRQKAIPFHDAARIGTEKVIRPAFHQFGIVVTTDGRFLGRFPEKILFPAEEQTIKELKSRGKPFLILVNSQTPYSEETGKTVKHLEEKFGVSVLAVNCEQLRKEDVTRILEKILYEFPVSEIELFVPRWVEMLSPEHEVKAALLNEIREKMTRLTHVRDVSRESVYLESPYVEDTLLEQVSLSDGKRPYPDRSKMTFIIIRCSVK